MPVVQNEVSSYSIELRATPQENVGLVQLFAGPKLLCQAAFVDGSQPLPGPRESPAGVVALAFRYSWLGDAVDLLRNEKPVWFTWARETQLARIASGPEPAGEGERPVRAPSRRRRPRSKR